MCGPSSTVLQGAGLLAMSPGRDAAAALSSGDDSCFTEQVVADTHNPFVAHHTITRLTVDATSAAQQSATFLPAPAAGGGFRGLSRRSSVEQRSPNGVGVGVGYVTSTSSLYNNNSNSSSNNSNSSSCCSIVHAIAALGLDGAPAAQQQQDAAATGGSHHHDAAAAPPHHSVTTGVGTRRGSISKAKRILAEALSSVPGAHGLAPCGSSDTGVLSPLLSIIRNNGAMPQHHLGGGSAGSAGALGCWYTGGGGSGSVSSRRPASRRSSFNEALLSSSGAAAGVGLGLGSSSSSRRVLRRASFSEAAGGLNSAAFGADASPALSCATASGIGCASIEETQPLSPTAAGAAEQQQAALRGGGGPPPGVAAAAQQQQQRVIDCIDTIRYLAIDDSNRMALLDLGAVELLLAKLQPSARGSSGSRRRSSSAGSRASFDARGSIDGVSGTPVVAEAALAALAALARHDATKLRVWEHPGSSALLSLMAARHTSPLTKATHLCVAHLSWSGDADASAAAGAAGASAGCCRGVFDSVSSHAGRDDAASNASSSCGANVLLAPALIPALAAGLHPSAEAPVLLSLLKLLSKAASSSCLATPASSTTASSCCSDDGGDDSDELTAPGGAMHSGELCAVQPAQSAAWRVGWQQVIFALPPLLALHEAAAASSSSVVAAALELLGRLCELHPELHMLVCSAGCLPPLLHLLVAAPAATTTSSSRGTDTGLQAACVLTSLLDCPTCLELLGEEAAVTALLAVLDDSRCRSPGLRVASLHMLRRLAAAAPGSAPARLRELGAVEVVVALLQQAHDSDVRHGGTVLLQLLGKQVLLRPSRKHHHHHASSSRSSFESTERCSFDSAAGVAGDHHGARLAAAADAIEALVLCDAGAAATAAADSSGGGYAAHHDWQRQQHHHHPRHHHHHQHSTLHAC